MLARTSAFAFVLILWSAVSTFADEAEADKRYPESLSLKIPPISTDDSVRYDYDIAYVRVPRQGDEVGSKWAEIAHPVSMDPGGDLMLLHPDGSEEVLVPGGKGSVVDPMVSHDGQWIFYSHIHDMHMNWAGRYPKGGADIYKIHVASRKIVRLTEQKFTPNTGAAQWSQDFVSKEQDKNFLDYGVFNMGPCPLPGGRLVFRRAAGEILPAAWFCGSYCNIVLG